MHAACDHLRVSEDLFQIVDRACGHASRFAGSQKIVFRPCLGGLGDAAGQVHTIRNAVCIRGEIGCGGHVLQPQHLAQALVLAVIAGCQNNPAIGAIKHRVGGKVGVGVAHFTRSRAGCQVIHRLIGHNAGCHIHQSHIDMLAHARRATLMQGGQNGGGGIDAGKNIRHCDADFLRLTARFAGNAHQPGHALDNEIIARTVGIRAGLAKPGDRTIDQAGVDRGQIGVIQPVFCQAADFEVFDHHVGVGNQGAHLGLPFGGAKIADYRGFAAIGGIEISGGLVTTPFDKGRPPAAGIIAFGGLYLDHVRAQIGQGLARPRACQNPGQFDNLYASQRRGHGLLCQFGV